MKKRLKITEGKAVTLDHNWSDTSVCINAKSILTLSIYDEATEDTQEALESEMSANAELISDAFNTANETQLLPSELKEQRDFYKRAYDLAMELERSSPCDPDITEDQIQAHKEYRSFVEDNLHIINKIKDNE